MYVCMCAYIYIYLFFYLCVYIYTYTYIYVYTYIYIYGSNVFVCVLRLQRLGRAMRHSLGFKDAPYNPARERKRERERVCVLRYADVGSA